MNSTNDQTVAQQAAQVVDNAADGIRSVGGRVRYAAQTVQAAGTRAVNAVEDTCQQVSDRTRESVKYGLSQVRACESGFERCVRDNPKSSLLVAAALGGALVAWFSRR
jgi:ElaB/YqjD/DUF883 family membrane-anchored ribosome-binding protein